MKQFLNEETIQRSRIRAARSTRMLRVLAFSAAAVLIILCLLTRTGNARGMLYAAWISTILLGWGAIALWLFRAEPDRAEERHLKGLAEGEAATYTGRLFLRPDSFRIPKSVRVCKVRLETEEEPLSLNLNEKLRQEMPPDGSLVRVTAVRKFITGLEVLESGTQSAPRNRMVSGWKRGVKAFCRFFPAGFLWALMALILIGFVFNRITDTDPAHKITLYADCEVLRGTELAETLENGMGGAVQMVKVHPFTYALFGTGALKGADLYIVPDSRAAEYREWFDALPGTPEEGTPVYDPENGLVTAGDCFRYTAAGEEPEIYRLYFGAASPHREDGLALKAAELFFGMTDTQKEETP